MAKLSKAERAYATDRAIERLAGAQDGWLFGQIAEQVADRRESWGSPGRARQGVRHDSVGDRPARVGRAPTAHRHAPEARARARLRPPRRAAPANAAGRNGAGMTGRWALGELLIALVVAYTAPIAGLVLGDVAPPAASSTSGSASGWRSARRRGRWPRSARPPGPALSSNAGRRSRISRRFRGVLQGRRRGRLGRAAARGCRLQPPAHVDASAGVAEHPRPPTRRRERPLLEHLRRLPSWRGRQRDRARTRR